MEPADGNRGLSRLTFDFIRPPGRRVSMRSDLLQATNNMIVVATDLAPSKPVEYLGEIVMDAGYRAVWFLFKEQPFDIGRIYRPDGTWTGYYADVLEPVRWDGSDPTTLEPIIDLFLDLWIAPDGRFEVLDVDEFEEAGARGSITAYQIDHARRVLQKMIEATGRGDFPPAVVKQFLLRNTQPQEGHWS